MVRQSPSEPHLFTFLRLTPHLLSNVHDYRLFVECIFTPEPKSDKDF